MAKKIIKAQMKQRQDTKANWAAANPVLLDGELGMVSDDRNLYKVGDGRTAWNDLPFRGFDGTLAQELGTSPNAAISQKAVTEKLTELSSNIGNAFINQGRLFDLDYGAYAESANFDATDYLKVGKRIKGRMFLGANANPYCNITFFDKDKKIISRYFGERVGIQDFDLTTEIPVNAVYFVASNLNSYREESYILYDGYAYVSSIERSESILENVQLLSAETASKITELQGKTLAKDYSPIFDQVGYFQKNLTMDKTTDAQNTGYVNVKGYYKVYCNCSLSSGGYVIAFFDENKKFISGFLGESSNNKFEYMADVPDDAYYAIFSNYGTWLEPKATIYAKADSLAMKINDAVLKSSVESYVPESGNLFDKSKVIVGQEVYGDGSLSPEKESAASDYIDIQGAKTIFFNNLPIFVGIMRRCAFYDENKNFISMGYISESSTKASVSVPDDAVYCRFSLYQRLTSGSKDYEQVTVNTQSIIDYVPYVECLGAIGGFAIPKKTFDVLSKIRNKKALLFGDSITETATISDDGVTYNEGTRVNWPTFALPMLEISSFRNYAKSGATYKDSQSNTFRQDLSEQIQMALADVVNDDADLVVMSLGTNDGAVNIGTYEAAMNKTSLDSLDRSNLYEALRWAMWTLRTKYPNAKFFVGLPIQRTDREQPEEMLTAIKKMAHRYNFIVIDATDKSGIVRDFEVSGANGLFLSDGLHPNAIGAEKLGRFYANEILTNSIF